MTIAFSFSFRNQAVDGLRGIKIMNRTPAPMVRPPQTRKRTLQGAMAMFDCPIPYIKSEPKIWATPFIETHVATRIGCSRLMYQFDVMMMNAGDTVPVCILSERFNKTYRAVQDLFLPSAKPRKNLAAARPWKLWHAAMAMLTPPQITIVTPTYIVIGRRDKR